MEENSISIINKNNGSLTGEKAQALPVKFVTSLSWIKILLLGFLLGLATLFIFIYTSQKQVVVVEVSGKADNFQLLEIQ